MVASISARGGAAAALAYYDHLGRDDYYARGGEPYAGISAPTISLTASLLRAGGSRAAS
jgi:hypothetical protein